MMALSSCKRRVEDLARKVEKVFALGVKARNNIYCSKLSGIEVGFYSNHYRPVFIQPEVILLARSADHHSLFVPGLAPSLWGNYLKS